VGLGSDTHGLADERLLQALAGCELLLHAGDIGPGVLERLRSVAPVVAVRGNTDRSAEFSALPFVQRLELAGHPVALVHRREDAPADGWRLLVCGHTHRPCVEERDGRWVVNPGAAGRRGFHDRRTAALLELEPGRPPLVRLIDLGPRRGGEP